MMRNDMLEVQWDIFNDHFTAYFLLRVKVK